MKEQLSQLPQSLALPLFDVSELGELSQIGLVEIITDMYLETPRLMLREMTEHDVPALREILQDDETMAAYEGAFDEAMTLDWLQSNRQRYHAEGFGLLGVVLRPTNELIGQCGLTRQHILDRDVVEVGYLLNRAHWHRGYATEAARACLNYAFEQLEEENVWAQVRDTNIASMNVAIRLGMTVRGRFEKHYRGVAMPHLAFAVDRPGATPLVRE